MRSSMSPVLQTKAPGTVGVLIQPVGVRTDNVRIYTRYRYFGVSALGGYPTGEQQVSYSGIQPYRVTDPFMWLLSELGVVGRERRR